MLGIFWELRQQHLIRNASAEAGLAAARSARTSLRLEDLADKLDRLTLICMGMWTLIQEKTGLTEEQLIERVQELDLMDGADDDKLTPPVQSCPRCRRPMSLEHKRCLYCGQQTQTTTAFEAV